MAGICSSVRILRLSDDDVAAAPLDRSNELEPVLLRLIVLQSSRLVYVDCSASNGTYCGLNLCDQPHSVMLWGVEKVSVVFSRGLGGSAASASVGVL